MERRESERELTIRTEHTQRGSEFGRGILPFKATYPVELSHKAGGPCLLSML